jgi:uncharacterized protein DUF3617
MKHFPKVFSLSSLVSVCVFVAGNAYAAQPTVPMTPGQWEITIHPLEPFEGPPLTTVTCVTPEMVAKIDGPKTKRTDPCQATPATLVNGVLEYTVNCAKTGRKSSTKITYAGDTYSGTVIVETPNGMIKQSIEAHRLGECDSQE